MKMKKIMSLFEYDVKKTKDYIVRIANCSNEVKRHNLIFDLWQGDKPIYNGDTVSEETRMSETDRMNIYIGAIIMAMRGNKTARRIFCDGVSSGLRTTIPGRRFEYSKGNTFRIYDSEDSCAGYPGCFEQCGKCTISIPSINSDAELEVWMKTLTDEERDTVNYFLSNLWYETFMVPYQMNGGKYIENRDEPVCPELYRY